MRLLTAIATSLAAVSGVFAVQFNGLYKITSLNDGTALTLSAQSKVVSLSNATTKSSTWYISSGPASSDFAWISNVRPAGVLTANVSFSTSNDLDRSQALGTSFYSDAAGKDRTQQAWKINSVTRNSESVFEIESAAFRNELLDIRGDGTNTRQVLVYPRNGGANQLWRITSSSFFDGETV